MEQVTAAVVAPVESGQPLQVPVAAISYQALAQPVLMLQVWRAQVPLVSAAGVVAVRFASIAAAAIAVMVTAAAAAVIACLPSYSTSYMTASEMQQHKAVFSLL